MSDAVGQAVIELLQYAYPEEWIAMVDAIRKGALAGKPNNP